MRLRRGVLATVVLVAGATVTSTPQAVSAPAPTAPTGPTHTVTLVTGDQVTMSSDGGKVSAAAGPGREGITFDVTTDGGRVRVVPSDAGPLLLAGRLDERLFDVTGLVAAGYDRTAELPLILTDGMSRTGRFKRTRDLPAVNGTAVRQPKATAAQSWRALRTSPGTGKVWLDGMRQPALDVSVPRVGAPAAWEAGYTGAGSTVAVLDSGIDDSHPDLAGQVAARRNFTEGYEPDADLTGHGTHVASTVAGTGAGRYKGVAPGAKLLDGKVCVEVGCAESWILAGMTWAAAEQHADVVNLSLGAADDPTAVDPIEEAVQTLSDQYGTLFVVTAGNTDGGVLEGAITSPGTAEAALTVGAVDDSDVVPGFSRRGPTGDGRLKPDIVAPGVDITAAQAGDGGYVTMSGTSMAAPHVAGAAAIMAQRHPDWSGQRLKAALMASARPNPADGVYAQGAGRLDVTRAVGQAVSASPAGVGFAPQQWPHHDDEVQRREVTYHNAGPVAESLALTVDGAPEGMFTVSTDSVTVPAGGDATVTVTLDSRMGPDGNVGGWLTATGPDQVVSTPVAVTKEVESYDVTLNHLGRHGGVPDYFTSQLVDRDSHGAPFGGAGPNPGGTMTVRMPAGHYTLTSRIYSDVSTSDSSVTLLAQPEVHVDRPLTIDLDARAGLPISVTVPQPSATQVHAEVGARTDRMGKVAGTTVIRESFAGIYAARIGPDIVDDRFSSYVAGQWAQAKADGSIDDSPYLYTTFFPVDGRMVHGYQRAVAEGELAGVRADVAQTRPGTQGTKRVIGHSPGLGYGFLGVFMRFQLPFTRTEYYSTDGDIQYMSQFLDESSTDGSYTTSESALVRYEAGRSYRERWNTAVFAPSLPASSLDAWLGVVRDGNQLVVDVPMFGNGAGHLGTGMTTASSATLFRDGTKIGGTDGMRFGSIEMPRGGATYRLETHAERGAPFELSTRTDIAWTFRSGHTDAPVKLPLWTFRFSPKADQYNALPAGGVHAVPVVATPQSGSATGTLAKLAVDASFDDGATWRRVPVVGGVAKIPHPQGNGFVSLRAMAADSAGNTVTQTVVHAYRYGRP